MRSQKCKILFFCYSRWSVSASKTQVPGFRWSKPPSNLPSSFAPPSLGSILIYLPFVPGSPPLIAPSLRLSFRSVPHPYVEQPRSLNCSSVFPLPSCYRQSRAVNHSIPIHRRSQFILKPKWMFVPNLKKYPYSHTPFIQQQDSRWVSDWGAVWSRIISQEEPEIMWGNEMSRISTPRLFHTLLRLHFSSVVTGRELGHEEQH